MTFISWFLIGLLLVAGFWIFMFGILIVAVSAMLFPTATALLALIALVVIFTLLAKHPHPTTH
jgi:hypothetical protein